MREQTEQALTDMWRTREGMVTRPSNGLPSDQELLYGLWKELGVVPNEAVAEH